MKRQRKAKRWVASTLRWVVVSVAVLVLVLPWLRQATGINVLDGFDWLLGKQCHRLEGRVLWLHGLPMAVCSRCAGIYFGVAVGAGVGRPSWSVKTTVWAVIAAGTAMSLEAAMEAMGWIGVVHPLRMATGAALSWPVGALAVRWSAGKS